MTEGARILRYTVRRVIIGLLLMFVVSILIFFATAVLPGDGAQALLGRNANPQALAELRKEFGLDHSLVTQYVDWVGGLFTGNLGTSFASRTPVTELLAGRFFNTFILASLALLLIVPISLALGTFAGIRSGRMTDHAISTGTVAAAALPEFVVGTVLVLLFAVKLRLLPAVSLVQTGDTPLDQPQILVLPVATLVIVAVAANTRLVRAGVREQMTSDYVEAARLSGLSEPYIIRHHVLRNSLAPAVQSFALTAQYLIGGVIVVEIVFQYPGLGGSLVAAVGLRDIPVVQSLALLIAFAYILLNIIADVVVIVLNPRLRTEI